MTKIFCAKVSCIHNQRQTPTVLDSGVCQKEILGLEIYPGDHLPAACADYEEEEKRSCTLTKVF
jgi:hypothetical protein